MSPEAFAQLFTREALRPFQPKPGSEGFTPMLEVHTPGGVVVFVLALDDFNDAPTRWTYLHALGATCAQKSAQVDAIRFGSEAWIRVFTPQEVAAQHGRLVETYPDKEEGIIVFGQHADGGMRMAQAKVYRRPTGAIERLGPWKVTDATESSNMQMPLLEAFWDGYRQGTSPLH